MFRELRSVGVRVHPSAGGFYLMPDFGVCKAGLKRDHGITTSDEMCNLMLKEAKVAVSFPISLQPLLPFLMS